MLAAPSYASTYASCVPVLVSPFVCRGALSDRAQPRLAAADLDIRPWSEHDAPFLVEAYADPEIQRWHVRTMDTDEAHEWITARTDRWEGELGADWVVTRGGTPVGRVGLRAVDLDEGHAEVAYWVVPAARGQGLAVIALGALSAWAFDSVGFHRLDLHHSVENTSSCRLAAKCGYDLEGIARSSVLHGDGWHDMHLHARVKQGVDS